MVKASKTSEKTTTETKPRAKKVAAPAPAPVVEVAPTTPAPAVVEEVLEPVDAGAVMSMKLSEFNAKLQQLVGLFSAVKNDFKTLEKTVNREMKAAIKASSKKRRNTGNRKPSGFIKPTRISDELAGFLGKDIGTEMARTEVTREINTYIRAHSLQDKDNGRKIIPDTKLKGLLKIKKGEELTYFNLQKYMSPHFAKASDKIAAVTAAAV